MPSVPGFKITIEGFRSSSGGSDTFRFVKPLVDYRATKLSDRSVEFLGAKFAELPQIVRANLRSPGFEMNFPIGMKFNLDCLLSPYLSWSEGSVGADVPTPSSKWVLVSFRDKQPPVLIVFQDEPVGLIVRGTSGSWTLSTVQPYSGWVRVCLPLGQYTKPGLSARSLGEIVQEVEKNIDHWTSETPSLVDFQIRTDEESVTAVWTFDRPGALVPPAAMMARTGGYMIQILTGVTKTDADLWDGPTSFTTEPKLAIRFPLRRVPSGRSLTVGARPRDIIATASPFDVPSLCDLALANITAGRDALVSEAAESVTTEFLEMANYTVEPHSRQRFPYAASGAGIDLVAAHALVVQSRLASAGTEKQPNRFFKQVTHRRDWYSWLIWADDQTVARRASAALAVAGALSANRNEQLEGCMLQAGLAAERALALYRDRRGFPNVRNELNEPMFPVRMGLYRTGPNLFVDSLMSEVRVLSGASVVAESTPEGVLLKWVQVEDGPSEMRFYIARPVTASAVANVEGLKATQSLGTLRLRFFASKVGECSVLLKSPGWTNPLPPTYSPPRYSEGR